MERRGMGRAVAVVGIVALVLLAFELLRPREYLLGTNGAGSQGPVVQVAGGQQLCVGGLDVPAATRFVRLRYGPLSAPVGIGASTGVQGGAGISGQPGTGGSLPAAAGPPGSTPGSLVLPVEPPLNEVCVTPDAPVAFAGRPGRESDDPPPTLGGAPLDARVEVVFLPEEGAERSLIAQLPDIARRAALFRPGWVGDWTYWALLIAVWPGLAAAGLLVLLRPPARRLALVVGLIGFGLSASWALLSPAFSTPDETEHFAFAQTVAEHGTTPELDPPGTRRAFSSEQQLAWEHLDLAGFLGQREGRPPWNPDAYVAWRVNGGIEAAEQADGLPAAARDDGGGPQVASAYQPHYYAALAPAYHLSGGTIFARLTAMRLVSALLAGLVAAFTVLVLLELAAPRWAAAGGGLLVAFQPMSAFLGGAVNNDAAINAAAAGLLWLLVRALRRGLSPRLATAIGAAIVVALYAKGSGVFLLPAALLTVLILARTQPSARHLVAPPQSSARHLRAPTQSSARHLVAPVQGSAWHRRGVVALLGGALAAAVVCGGVAVALDQGPWPLAPARVAADGNAFPTSPGSHVQTGQVLRHPVAYATHLWELVLPPLPGMEDLRPPGYPRPGYTIYVKRAWGAFGFASILFPGWVYAVIALVMAAVAALAIRAALRERAALRARAWPAAVLALTGIAVVLGVEAVWFSPEQRPTLGSYGRYAFPALVPAAVLVTFASFGLGRRRAPALLAGLVTAVIALHLAAVWLNVSALYV